MTKTCIYCGGCFDRTAENFYRNPTSSDGFSGKCKPCEREKVRAYKASRRGREKAKAWLSKPENRERVRANVRRRRRRPDVIAQERADRRAPGVQAKRSAYDAIYYRKNATKIRAQKVAYRLRRKSGA